MRVTLPRMISPGSLAAFSASVATSLPSARAGQVPGLLPGVVPVREQTVAVQAKPGAAGRGADGVFQPPAVAPGTKLPRGSLLNLQV